jgi:hypothetical protein
MLNQELAMMKPGRRFIPMYHSYLKSCAKLTDEEFGRVVRALFDYSINSAKPEGLNDKEAIAFDFMSQDVARAAPPDQPVYRKPNNKEVSNVETLKKLLE